MSHTKITRQILTEIDRNPAISQKQLSQEIGISVGMINWHVKRCVKKGLVKLKQAPARRYLYYLTAEGFSEKAKLTANYLRASFRIFQTGQRQYSAIFQTCQVNNWNSLVLLGYSELTELAVLVAEKFSNLFIIGIVDVNAQQTDYSDIPILSSFEDVGHTPTQHALSAVIVCDFAFSRNHQDPVFAYFQKVGLQHERLLMPDFLR